ncbi:MAG: hypothetical protein IPK60_15475 [Sandaracinaceae bacterium]|jgi:hypothetical protein|nr:hypothetical protein [Sandaracinaceae bacterium]
MKWLRYIAIVLALHSWTLTSLAQDAPELGDDDPTHRINVRVVEVAGQRAYLEPGENAGLIRGSTVMLGRRRYTVVAATSQTAAIELRSRFSVSVGERGTGRARVRTSEADRLPQPRALSAFQGQWPRTTLPASTQHPTPVPLTESAFRNASRVRVQISETSGMVVPLGGQTAGYGRAELRARVHAQPFQSTPFSLDADVSAQMWLGSGLDSRPGAASRPIYLVRELAARYGAAGNFEASLGRLRYAATNVGMLDGLRLRSPSAGGFSVAAFGGMVPNLYSGAPQATNTRFGVEALYEDLNSELRPTASVLAHGSVFDGSLDEKRISGGFDIYPGQSRIGARTELSFFDAGNAWGAPTVDLSAFAFDMSTRYRDLRFSFRFDIRRPERSRWLASLLPTGWLCTQGRVADPNLSPNCSGVNDARYNGTTNIAYEGRLFRAEIGGNITTVARHTEYDQLAGYASLRAVRIANLLRLDIAAFAAHGSLIDTIALRTGVGVTIFNESLSLYAYYRPAKTQYNAGLTSWIEHRVGGELWFLPSRMFDFGLTVEGVSAPDASALVVLTTASFRPTE